MVCLLSKFLNPSPRSKYLSFERYGGTIAKIPNPPQSESRGVRDIALKEAIAYRDSVINK